MGKLLLGELTLDPQPPHIRANDLAPVHRAGWSCVGAEPLGTIVPISIDMLDRSRSVAAMFDLWSSEHSVLREKVVEHIFLAELSKALLLEMGMPFEVLRAEFDAFGYDVVIEAGGIMRHIQLKATRRTGARGHVDVQLALTRKPGGCVVWIFVDPASLTLGPFLWLGGSHGQPLQELGDRPTRNSRPNSRGEKKVRAGHRRVSKGTFERFETMAELAKAMFPAPADEQGS